LGDALWSRFTPRSGIRNFSLEGFTKDQRDAYCIADELSRADRDGRLMEWLKPNLTPLEAKVVRLEGWILGAAGTSGL